MTDTSPSHPNGLPHVRAIHRQLEVESTFTRTLGWSVEEMLARPFLDFVHPDDHVRTLREVERQIANGELVQPREGGGSEFILLFGNNSVVNGPGSHQPSGAHIVARSKCSGASSSLRPTSFLKSLTV